MHKKTWIVYAFLFVSLVGAAGQVWLTYNPRSPIFDRLNQWPVVGWWTKRLQEAYLPTEAPVRQIQPPPPPKIIYRIWPPSEERKIVERESTDGEGPPVPVPRTRTPEEVEAIREALLDARIERIRAREFRWFRPGVAVRMAPEPDAPEWLTLEAPQRFSFQERRDGWARVRLGAFAGWIPVSDETLMTEPPLGSEPALVEPVPGRKADPRLLERARDLMGSVQEGKVGGYTLLTDVQDEVFLRDLDATVRGVAKAHVGRYHLRSLFPGVATVILFRDEATYREFQDTEDYLADLNPRGHTGKGVVALYRGDRGDHEVAGTLAHEVAHLINRRAMGPALPPWLDEGVAEDISLGFRKSNGRIDFARLAGGVERSSARTHTLHLGYASLERLRRAMTRGKLLPLEQLLNLDWYAFVKPGDEERNYAQSAFFMRFLQDDRERAKRFRWYLEGIAKGKTVHFSRLLRELDKSWEELDAEFEEYLEEECRRYLGVGRDRNLMVEDSDKVDLRG